MSVAVREADTSDLPAIHALLAASDLPVADITPQAAAWFLLAVKEDAVIGTVAFEPCGSFGLLRSLAVRVDRRGEGIGQQLVAACEGRAHAARLCGLYLLTVSARHFFHALGYDELERWELPESIRDTLEYRVLCSRTAVAMTKRLR